MHPRKSTGVVENAQNYQKHNIDYNGRQNKFYSPPLFHLYQNTHGRAAPHSCGNKFIVKLTSSLTVSSDTVFSDQRISSFVTSYTDTVFYYHWLPLMFLYPNTVLIDSCSCLLIQNSIIISYNTS